MAAPSRRTALPAGARSATRSYRGPCDGRPGTNQRRKGGGGQGNPKVAKRAGWPMGKPSARPVEERLWEKVDKSAGPDGCWPWLGAIDQYGRAQIWWNRRVRPAARAAFFLATGVELPSGIQ